MALSIVSIGAVASAALAVEFTPVEAKLVTPVEKPVKKTIDGRPWICKGDLCTANGMVGRFQPIKNECASAAKALGAFASYRNDKDTLDEAALAACNSSKG